MVSGDTRTMTWSAFGKPTRIVRGTAQIDIAYGPSRARYKRTDTTASGITITRYAMGGAYELITRPDLSLEKKHYIGGIAVITETSGSSIVDTKYLHRDHLGSVDAITDVNGALTTRHSFDSWGKRRNANWTAMSMSAITIFDTSITTRGFTGHEQLDPVGLIHMNGRVYDAELGRFLSADPNVQDIENMQSFNRYSYVLNNPLSYTDPSGFFFNKIFKAIGSFFKAAFNAIKSVFKAILKIPLLRTIVQIVACGGSGPAGWAACAGAAAAFAAAAGGSIGDALMAAATTLAQIGIWDAVGTVLAPVKAALSNAVGAFAAVKGAVHGVVGGAICLAQGGNFLEGFAANAIGAAAGVASEGVFGPAGNRDLGGIIGRTASAAAAGGAAALAAGGKFANGALTAAFANLYNAEGGFIDTEDTCDELCQEYGDDYALLAVAAMPLPGVAAWLGLGTRGLIQNPLFKSALQPFSGRLTAAGRALTKHPNIVGAKSAQELAKLYGHQQGISKAAANALKNIMRNGTRTTKPSKAFGKVVDFKLNSGLGARFSATTNNFIGFLGRN